MLRAVVVAGLVAVCHGAPVSPQTEIQPQEVPLQAPAEAPAAAAVPAVPATSPGPLLDWATGQPLPVAPVAEAPPVPAAQPAGPAAVPAEAVADTSPLPQMYEGDTRITGAADSNCVSIMAGTSDWWCATTCATRQDAASCPPTMCKCDAAAKADADAKAAAAITSHKEAEDAIKAATDAMAPAVSPAAVAPVAVAPVAVAPAAAVAPEGDLISHEEAEAQVKAAADAVKAAADEVKASMLPSPVPGAAAAKRCTAILETASDEWCETTCATSYCPPTACKCDEPEEAAPKMKLDTTPAEQEDAEAVAVDASPAPDGPGVDWATGQPLPQAPTAIPEPAYEMPVDPAVPQVAEAYPAVSPVAAVPAAPVAQAVPAVAEAVPVVPAVPVAAAPVAVPVPAVPAPVAAPVDDRIANAADSNCVSIMAGTSDWWCATTCASSGASASACPATMCKCDDDAKAESDAKAAEALAAQTAAEDVVKAAAEEMTGVPAAAVSPAPVAVAVAPVAVTPVPVAQQQQAQDVASTFEEDDQNDPAAAHKAAEDAVREAAATAPGVTAAAVPAASPEPAGKNCKAILETASDEWCETTCATSYCPPTACKCDE